MNTTVPTVKAKLLEMFKAAVEEETEVWPTRPNEEHQTAEDVYLGAVRGRRVFVTMPATAPGSREETYEVMVEVEVEREGTDLDGTEARMWEIADTLEALIAASPRLQDTVDSAICTAFDQSTPVNQAAVLAKYMFGVEVTARI